jgi:hypothetical protein
MCVLTWNNIPVQASEILPVLSPFYGIKVSIYHHPRFNTNTGGGQSLVL